MAIVSTWLKDKFILLLHLLLYLLIELLTLTTIVIVSVAICHCLSQLVSLIFRFKVDDVGQAYIVVTSVGVASAQVPKSWRHSLIPVALDEVQERKHPVFFGVIRIFIIISALVFCVSSQYCTYQFKYGATRKSSLLGGVPKSEKDLYTNDIVFFFSLTLMTFVMARIIQSYREFSRLQRQYEVGPEGFRSPHCFIYFFYYFSLLFVELICTVPLFILMSGVATLCVLLKSPDYVTYYFPVTSGYAFGHLLGLLEHKYFSLDAYYERFEPYFSTIHWDARLNVVVFTLVPLLSRWYFHTAQDQAEPFQNFIFFSGCIATTFLQFSKCQNLFSYVASRQLYRVNTARSLNRVHPESRPVSVSRELQQGQKSSLYYFFPLNLNQSNLPSDRDQTSISTGTCTSLLSRMMNNRALDIASMTNTSMKTFPRSPQHSVRFDENANANVPSNSKGLLNRVEFVVGTATVIPSPPGQQESDPIIIEESLEDVLDDSSQKVQVVVENEQEVKPKQTDSVKLKRCPSNLPLDLENENET